MKKIRHNIIGIFFLILVFIFFIILWPKENLYDKIIKEYDFQIIFALLTAIITTIIFYLYGFIKDCLNLRQYIGYWLVLRFDIENYVSLDAFVEIERVSEETLTYYYTDLKNLNKKIGTIFINKNNKKTGKLISGFEYINQVATFYPISESSVYFDLNTYKLQKPEPVIRIMDLNGNEKFILERPINQKEFRDKVKNLYSETIFKMATPLSQELIDKIIKPSR